MTHNALIVPERAITVPPVDTQLLYEMLRYARPHGGRSEQRFINRFIIPRGFQMDDFGNLWKIIYHKDGSKPLTMWSAHSDTVHRNDGKQRYRVAHDIVSIPRGSRSNCLGADNTAGVWVLLQLHDADCPGVYVIHRGEECGGLGSSFIADVYAKELSQLKHAIAFDRRGFADVITHQGWERTASDAFAWALADQLGPGFRPSDGGIFTDTANYSRLIPECSNVSIGFTNEHTDKETLDVIHAAIVAQQMIRLDIKRLPVVRDPNEIESKHWASAAYGHYDRNAISNGGGWASSLNDNGHAAVNGVEDVDDEATADDFERASMSSTDAYYRACELVRSHPEAMVDILEHMGTTPAEIIRAMAEYGFDE